MVTCILLSAGLSQRFGSPKALAKIGGINAIEHLQNTLLASSCDEIIIVLGAFAETITPSIFIHSRIRVVYNKDYIFGQTSSMQAGLQAAHEGSSGVLLLPVDCPLVKSSSIDQVIGEFNRNEPDILIPVYNGKKGHPPVFHQRLRSKILGLPHGAGLNSLFVHHPAQTVAIDDEGIIKSFNTPEEFEKITSKQ